MITRYAIALCLILCTASVFAQTDPLVEALRNYQAGDLPGARTQVDMAVTSSAHAEDPEAWLLRGFVYKDLFKTMASGAAADAIRQEALESLYTCMAFDPQNTYRDNARQAYDFLARSYFNEAARNLNEMDTERARLLFANYKAALLRVDPETSVKAREVEFGNALGTVYTKQFNAFRTDTILFDRAVEAFATVLQLDAENYGANYNLATLFYNRGVYNIQQIDAEDDIPSIEQIQRVSRSYFMKALPYMLKAHDMNPTRRETLLGLEGIYYSLQDQQNSEKFRQLFELLPQQEDR